MFVSYKHFPASQGDMVEWYERMKLSNNANNIPLGDIAELNYENITWNFYHIDPAVIEDISSRYPVHYYLGKPSSDYPYDIVYQNGEYALYRVSTPSRAWESAHP